MKLATTVAVVLLGLVALAHLWRLIAGIEATVGDWQVPMWVSVIGLLVPGGLAVLVWREHR